MSEKFIAFDLEMPGQKDLRISAIGITVVEDGEIVDSYYHLVNPETEFDPFVIDLVGITPEMVENEPTFPEIWRDIEDMMDGGILVAHGAAGDLKTLCACLQHYGIKWKDKIPYLCTCDIGIEFYPHLGHYSLDFLCDHIGVEIQHHNALSDSEGCARLIIDYMKNGFEPQGRLSYFNALKGQKVRKLKSKKKKTLTEKVQSVLFNMQNEKVKQSFLRKYPCIDQGKVIGVKDHLLYSYANNLCKQNKASDFVKNPLHEYHEENNLHAIIISKRKKFALCVSQIDEFIPYIDNYETADFIDPKIFRSRQPELISVVDRWLKSESPYAKAIALNTITRNFCHESYFKKWFGAVNEIETADLQLKRKKAEFFSDMLLCCEEEILPLLTSGEFDKWTHNMILQLSANRSGVKAEKKEWYVSLRR